MTTYSKPGLLTELMDRIELIKASTQSFLRLNNQQLNYSPGPGKWSIAEVFGHMNLAHDIHIRGILGAITKAPEITASGTDKYKSGWLGSLIYEKIMPRPDGSVFKFKTQAILDPTRTRTQPGDAREILQRFLQQLDMLDDILRNAVTKDLEKIRVPIIFTKMIKLRLGDDLRCLVAHCERHLLQAHRVVPVLPDELFDDHRSQAL